MSCLEDHTCLWITYLIKLTCSGLGKKDRKAILSSISHTWTSLWGSKSCKNYLHRKWEFIECFSIEEFWASLAFYRSYHRPCWQPWVGSASHWSHHRWWKQSPLFPSSLCSPFRQVPVHLHTGSQCSRLSCPITTLRLLPYQGLSATNLEGLMAHLWTKCRTKE